jgi:hypothetical protein
MYRYEVVAITGTGTAADPRRPNTPAGASWVCVGEHGSRMLVCRAEVDGTAPTATTVADLSVSVDPVTGRRVPALNVNADALTAGQLTTIQTWLTSQGFDLSQWSADNPADRRALLVFVLRRVFGFTLTQITNRDPLTGFMVDGG